MMRWGLEVGRKFYNDLAKIVGRFRDGVKAFVYERREEAMRMESYVPKVSFPLTYINTQACSADFA